MVETYEFRGAKEKSKAKEVEEEREKIAGETQRAQRFAEEEKT
jgi:hypothetical protein